MWVELGEQDARALDLEEGDLVEVRTPRGALRARLRVTALRTGVAFVPFHYGDWDCDGDRGEEHDRAANELTITERDPASKQPLFKVGAARVTKLEPAGGCVAPAPTTTASAPVRPGLEPTRGGEAATVAENA